MIEYTEMENQIEEIKRKIDIVEFIGSFITLKKRAGTSKPFVHFIRKKVLHLLSLRIAVFGTVLAPAEKVGMRSSF